MIDTDYKLIWVYRQLNLNEWVDFVEIRQKIIKQDILSNFEE